MRTRIMAMAVLLCGGLVNAALAEDKAVAILFGPAGAEAGQKAGAAIADRVYEWLRTPGTAVELRRPQVREGQEIMKFMQPKAVQDAVADAAKAGMSAGLDRFLDAVELGASAVARRPGAHYLILALEAPAPNDDLKFRLKAISDDCKQKKVQVLVWDLSAAPAQEGSAWQVLAAQSGGALAGAFAHLEAKLPAAAAPVVAAKAAAAAEATPAAPEGPVVYVGMFRTAPASARRSGATVGAMTGLFLTEVPMSSLKFQTQGSNATARVQISQVVKKKSGEVTWQASKELTVKSAASKLDARKKGSICYARQVQLPGGEYVLESTVKDLLGEIDGKGSVPLTAVDSIPGLAASGAIFARKLDKQVDLFEGDDIIQYDGMALAPMLNPVFPANEPFELPVYFLVYPDMNGKRPEMRLDIFQNGQPVGGTDIAFTDKLRDDARSGGTGISGEQKHEFPYLAKLANAMFLAGNYEVKITIKQDKQEVTRNVKFKVAEVK